MWASEGHGKSVLEKFYKQLTKEQLASIKVVTGDGAKWITECVNSYTPECARCVDSFHVVEWAMTALDEVRRDVWHDAYDEYKQIKKDNPRTKGRPKADDESIASAHQHDSFFKQAVVPRISAQRAAAIASKNYRCRRC